jgi:hypothetical protein
MQLGMVALETSRIAMDKARSDNLKSLSEFRGSEAD